MVNSISIRQCLHSCIMRDDVGRISFELDFTFIKPGNPLAHSPNLIHVMRHHDYCRPQGAEFINPGKAFLLKFSISNAEDFIHQQNIGHMSSGYCKPQPGIHP